MNPEKLAEVRAAVESEAQRPKKPPVKIVIHRGPIPGTNIGHHWFTDVFGERFGIGSSPHGVNKGWAYEIFDEEYRTVDDSMFSFDEIRQWARG